MRTVINISNVTDTSGETPVVTYSNTVTTLIRQDPISQIFIPRPRLCHCPFGICLNTCNPCCQMQNMQSCCPQFSNCCDCN